MSLLDFRDLINSAEKIRGGWRARSAEPVVIVPPPAGPTADTAHISAPSAPGNRLPNGRVAAHRDLLDKAAALRSAHLADAQPARADITTTYRIGDTNRTPAKTPLAGRGTIRPYSELLARAERMYDLHISQFLEEARRELELFRGIPARHDIVRIVSGEGNEKVLQHILAWLLSPAESHRCGDRFLRLFLCSAGLTLQGRAVLDLRPIEADVRLEVAMKVPHRSSEPDAVTSADKLSRPGDGNSESDQIGIRFDIVLLVEQTVIVVETKSLEPGAAESVYSAWGLELPQAEFYQGILAISTGATDTDKEGIVDRCRPFLDKHRVDQAKVRSLKLEFQKSFSWTSTISRVVSVLVRESERKDPTSLGDEDTPQSMASKQLRVLSWLDIANLAGQLMDDDLVDPEVRVLLQSFRSSIYTRVDDGNTIKAIEELRLRSANPEFGRRYPRQTIAAVRDLRRALHAARKNPSFQQHTARKRRQ